MRENYLLCTTGGTCRGTAFGPDSLWPRKPNNIWILLFAAAVLLTLITAPIKAQGLTYPTLTMSREPLPACGDMIDGLDKYLTAESYVIYQVYRSPTTKGALLVPQPRVTEGNVHPTLYIVLSTTDDGKVPVPKGFTLEKTAQCLISEDQTGYFFLFIDGKIRKRT